MKSEGLTTVSGAPVSRSAAVFSSDQSIEGTPIGSSGCQLVVL